MYGIDNSDDELTMNTDDVLMDMDDKCTMLIIVMMY